MGCYANAIAALVSMINFIIFITVSKRRPFKTSTQKNYNKAIQQEKHRRIMAADRALMKHFIMPMVKDNMAGG